MSEPRRHGPGDRTARAPSDGPDHPDRAADLGERADGAHEEFIEQPLPHAFDEHSASDEAERDTTVPSAASADTSTTRDAPPSGRKPAKQGGDDAGGADAAGAGGAAAAGGATPAGGAAGAPPPQQRPDQRRPIVVTVAAVLVLTGLIYLAMILGVFTVG